MSAKKNNEFIIGANAVDYSKDKMNNQEFDKNSNIADFTYYISEEMNDGNIDDNFFDEDFHDEDVLDEAILNENCSNNRAVELETNNTDCNSNYNYSEMSESEKVYSSTYRLRPEEQTFYGSMLKSDNPEDVKFAENRFIEAYCSFAASIARTYFSRVNYNTADCEDLISAANIALCTYAHGYDIDRGFTFATYICYPIKFAVKHALCEKSFQHYSSKFRNNLYSLNELVSKYQQNGLPLSKEDIMKNLSISEKAYYTLIVNYNAKIESLDLPISQDDEESYLGDFVADDHAEYNPELSLMKSDFKNSMIDFINELPEIESKCLCYTYGIHCEEKTKGEIAKLLDCSTNKVADYINKGIEHLKENHFEELIEFFEAIKRGDFQMKETRLG